jgi:hypothetical protein
MLSISEIVRSVYGVWRLARFDSIGMQWLDRTDEGFWRSFRVALLLVPVEIVMNALLVAHLEYPEPFVTITVVAGIAYVVSWTVFPVLSQPLIGALGRAERYAAYITALNWSRILIYAVLVPFALISYAAGPGVASVLQIAFFFGWGAYHWFITRTALDLGAGPAVGLTLMEMTLLMITDYVALALMSGSAPVAAS